MPASQPARLTLRIEIEREDDGRWIADVPALPGVMVYGATREEAIREVQMLALWRVRDEIEHRERAPIGGLDFTLDNEQPARLTLTVRDAWHTHVGVAGEWHAFAEAPGVEPAGSWDESRDAARARVVGLVLGRVSREIENGRRGVPTEIAILDVPEEA